MDATLRVVSGALVLLLGLGSLPIATSAVPEVPLLDAGCAPPCGPISVFMRIELEETEHLGFDAEGQWVREGTLVYWFDIDQDGYVYDPQNPPKITFRFPKLPPWLEAKVEPSEIIVDVGNPDYIVWDPAEPQQQRFEYRVPIAVTVSKEREPTAEELGQFVRTAGRHPGEYKVLIAAVSTPSQVDTGGQRWGLYPGWGVKELFFDPPEGTAQATEESADAPGNGMFVTLIAGAIGAVVVTMRRRRA